MIAAMTRARHAGLWLALAVSLATGTPAARADTLAEMAAHIQALLDSGQGPQAADAARGFLRAVTAQAGFGVTNARLTASEATGFGVYEPRADNVYHPGEPVYAYVEVYGFSLTPHEGGTNELLFDVSFTMLSPEGRQLTDHMVPMGDIRLSSFNLPVDGYFHLTYRINGFEGPSILRTHVVDRASGQSADFDLPVVFAAPDAAAAPSPGSK